MTYEIKIEKEWMTEAGYKAKVIAHPMGHRCGYVTVPETHPHWGKGYDDVRADVHGGLTYSDKGTFGFDCAHLEDIRDESIMSDEYRAVFTSDLLDRITWEGATLKTLEFCVAECESLAKQLKEQS
jgi:hypothetical protein